MTGQYWPFWAGALALGGIATLHAVWLGRPLGVSGSLARVARPSDPTGVGSVWVHVAFLCAIAAGALAAALIRGTFRIELAPGPSLRQLYGPWALVALAAGGALVGAGTRMAGGCTSGHGLSGCARLVPSSLIATGCFMAATVATSLLLKGLAP